MMENKYQNIILTVALILVLGVLWLTYFFYMLGPVVSKVNENIDSTPILVERGDGIVEVAELLWSENLIKSSKFFKLYSVLSGSAHRFKPGLYTFKPSMSSTDMVRSLVAGPGQEVTVLIKEGENIFDIDKKLASLGVLNEGELLSYKFLKSEELIEKYPFLSTAETLEGFLFPDTYRLFFDSEAEDIVFVFLKNFTSKVGPLISDEDGADYDQIPVLRRGIFSINDIISIASMIEREVPEFEDRRIVADIIYRRLSIDMPLQIDATVIYSKLTDSRFDTYKAYGLPPGPISNPGIEAINSVLDPKPSPYLYYLSDPETKDTIYSTDFGDHVINKEKYLK